MKKIFLVLGTLMVLSASLLSQTIIPSVGIFIPERNVNVSVKSGISGRLSIMPFSPNVAPLPSSIDILVWSGQKSNGALTAKASFQEASWALFVPILQSEDYFVGAGGGFTLALMQWSGPSPLTSDFRDRHQLQAGVNVDVMAIAYGIALKGDYRLRNFDEVVPGFGFGGTNVSLGYAIHF